MMAGRSLRKCTILVFVAIAITPACGTSSSEGKATNSDEQAQDGVETSEVLVADAGRIFKESEVLAAITEAWGGDELPSERPVLGPCADSSGVESFGDRTLLVITETLGAAAVTVHSTPEEAQAFVDEVSTQISARSSEECLLLGNPFIAAGAPEPTSRGGLRFHSGLESYDQTVALEVLSNVSIVTIQARDKDLASMTLLLSDLSSASADSSGSAASPPETSSPAPSGSPTCDLVDAALVSKLDLPPGEEYIYSGEYVDGFGLVAQRGCSFSRDGTGILRIEVYTFESSDRAQGFITPDLEISVPGADLAYCVDSDPRDCSAVRGDTFVRAFDRNPQDEFVLTDSDLAEIIGSVLGGLL